MKKVSQKKSQEQKRKVDKGVNIFFLCVGIAFFLCIIIYYVWYLGGEIRFEKTVKQYVGKKVPDNIICMVNNTIIPDTPDTITIDGKIYRGCCATCISKLQYNINNARYAIDPYSKHTIDKTKAYITAVSDEFGKVIYFESEDDFKKYSIHNKF